MNEKSSKLRITMVVVDARDVGGDPSGTEEGLSPLLHPAVHSLLEGLSSCSGIEVGVIYGRREPAQGEARRVGSLSYVPVPYKTYPIPGIGGGYAARTFALLSHIRRTRPDIVHAQGTERESGLVAALSGRPSLLTLHGNFREIARTFKAKAFSYPWFNAILESLIIPRVDGVICISNYTRKLIGDLNSRTWTLPNAVNDELFSVVNVPALGRVTCLATIVSRKNQLAFLEATDDLAAKLPELHIDFWGSAIDGAPYTLEFQSAVASRPWATYHGSAPIHRIPEILATADVLALPTLEDNCPVVILEAMAAGVPVVASDVGGIPDLVIPGSTGYLVSSDDQKALVDSLASIIQDRNLRATLSTNSKQEALARFKSEKIAQEHVEIYQNIHALT